jgi:tRNA-dihydrouridine synthase A
VAAMQSAVKIPVTVKCRIGVDEQDSYEELAQFVSAVAQAGCQTFIVHARKAWLKGLSPKQNRDVPPLRYEVVYALKRDFPSLNIIINGGITDLNQAKEILQQVDGVMLGREAYQNPYLLAEVDRELFGSTEPIISREQVIQDLLPYIEQQLKGEVRFNSIARHTLGLFHGEYGARRFRRYLSENATRPEANAQLMLTAFALTLPETI